jgi:ADP-heptose:LPS heptosyltransferase/GT2 family glycosyltransferase
VQVATRKHRRRSKAVSAAPLIQIEVDPAVTAGYMHDRYDLMVRGRALSNVPLEEITIRLNGTVIGRVQYGQSERTALTDGPCALQHGFIINIPLRCPTTHGLCTCILAARTQDGDCHEQSIVLLVDPLHPMPVTIASGPMSAPAKYTDIHPPVVMYVEQAALDDSGQLLVQGWAVSLAAMVAVQVFVDERCIGAAQLGGSRDDIGAAFPAYPNARSAGFALSKHIDLANGRISVVRVQAVSLNGVSHEAVVPLGRVRTLTTGPPRKASRQFASTLAPGVLPPIEPAPDPLATNAEVPDHRLLASAPASALPPEPDRAPDPRRQIRFHLDQIALDARGNLDVSGWAVCPIGIATITLDLDDQAMGVAELGLPRDDVGHEYPQIPMARYAGFRLAKALGNGSAGEHRIRVVVRNGLDDQAVEIRTIQTETIRIEHAPPAEPTHFRLEIDKPTVIAGAAVEPITGRLTIEGWALARSGISGIAVLLDGRRLGDAHYGLARQDVGVAFPDWVDAVRSGYAFHCPPRSLSDGDHVVQLTVRARNGDILEHRFHVQIRKSEDHRDEIIIRQRMTQVEADVSEDVLDSLGHRPVFRLILRQSSALDLEGLLATMGSLRGQVYRDWHLEIWANGAETCAGVCTLISAAPADLAERIDVIDTSDDAMLDRLIGAIDASIPSRFVGFVSAGDRFSCDALLRMAIASGLHRDADLLYADEIRRSPASREREPFFKPDFSPDLLASTNYIGRPWFASSALFGRTALTARELAEAGEYDAVLRCVEKAVHVCHVPALLCQRGVEQLDDTAMEAAALARAAARRGIAAEVLAGAVPGTFRFRRTEPTRGMVSIIIPTCAAGGHIETCIRSLRERTRYRNFEIICIDNIAEQQLAWKIWLRQHADTVVPMPDAFNWSQFNNRGAAAAAGEYLLFLNDDIEVTQPEWLDAMLEHAQRPEVAVVGPQLLYPDNKVQHAGMFLAGSGVARHAFRFAAVDEPCYFGLALTQRNVIAVTGACMLMRRSIYRALGGFEELHPIVNNDLDFCLRAHQGGKLIVFTPHASLVHHEAASRDALQDVYDFRSFEARWSRLFAAGDPYFSPHLSREADDYQPDDEPVETVFAGHPLFHRADIKRILVVKVDHIGDFVTAIPAIRRLKQIFPAAAIHVLASRAARALAEAECCIEEFIEFEFFHAVSERGPKQISSDEYQALHDRLAPYRFDIAIDLRKHLDTREVLRYTPARFLAGFDYMGQFPFLDIALEWEGDRHLERKRNHVSDDLINLIEAVGTAGMSERTKLAVPLTKAGPPEFLSDDARRLFDRPVVAVHPGVGNSMRQWPAEHFATLIDLLVEQNAVNALLIGGIEEAELAAEVLRRVANRDAVVSVVGLTSLRQLPELLGACALYIGNNSGPKHVAAALGVATIGIHSGVVDAIEWGPIGKRAVALRRNMACSPCYLSRREDCPRAFACMRGLTPAAVQRVAEILLARPLERRSIRPLIEAEPQTTLAPKRRMSKAKPHRSRSRRVLSVAAD